MNKVIVFSRFKSLLLLLFVFSSCGMSFVDSFGMESPLLEKKKDDNKGKSSTETISVLNDCHITFFREGDKRTVKKYDPIVNFISQGLYVFGFWDIYYNDKDTLIPTTFFEKDATIKNLFVNILTFSCYNFFSMKRYNKLSWLPFNSNNKLYLGITDLGFGDGVAGGIAGGLLGRIALVLDISSVLNYSFVKDKVTFTIIGVRPLWLMLCLLQNNISSYLKELQNCTIDVYDKPSGEELSFKSIDGEFLCILAYYISCFQILALEFKIMEHFSVQLCFGNLFYSLWNKLQKGEEKSPEAEVSSPTPLKSIIDID